MNVAQLSVEALDRFGVYESTCCQGQWYTNAEVMRKSCALATVLRDRGIAPGDRVVVIMPSRVEVQMAFHAIARIGAVIIPIMPQLIAAEIEYIVDDSGAETVITTPELAAKIVEATNGIANFRQILLFGDNDVATREEGDWENISPVVESAAPLSTMHACDAGDLALLVYTSGTTGRPKGVMLSHGNLICNVSGVAEMVNWPPRVRTMTILPMSHVYGIMLMYLGVVTGAVNVIVSWFEAKEVLKTIEEFRVERCSFVPAMLVALLRHPDRSCYDVSSLTNVIAGSAPLSEEVRNEFEQHFGCRLVDGYGQSEATAAVATYWDHDAFVQGACGSPIPGMEVTIRDSDNQPLPLGETGEICVRGPCVMLGYWKNEAATRESIVDGWLHSGDIGHMDERGFLFVTDRTKDIIIKGGENISPRQIEEILFRMCGVAEVSVYGVPDVEYQEEIAAAIVTHGQYVSEEAVRQHAGAFLAKFKVPKYVHFCDELPKNANGKVLKRSLRAAWRVESQTTGT